MAQRTSEEPKIEWKLGQKCEIYSKLDQKWIEAKVVDVFKDEEGEWVKVRFGRIAMEIPINSSDIRVLSSQSTNSFVLEAPPRITSSLHSATY